MWKKLEVIKINLEEKQQEMTEYAENSCKILEPNDFIKKCICEIIDKLKLWGQNTFVRIYQSS